MSRQARKRSGGANVTDVPGVVFVQLDGVAHDVLRRAIRSGDVPNLHRWLRDGSHHLVGWQTGWSSQTGVSQCGILHGSTVDMPAFRWVDKSTGAVVVSNHPKCAAAIEQAHSDGNGLLAHHGSSYGNLFSGDAERAVLTMSGAGRRKEGRTGAGYFGYFARPGQAIRTMLAAFAEITRERVAATRQRRRGVEPRVERGWVYALLRTFTTVITRDVSVQGVMTDMCEGRAAIYVDLLGYDEVAHHSGPERVDALAVLRDLDRQIGRIERTMRWAPRPYKIVVLSDHGQTQGATFVQRTGQTLSEFVAELCGAAASGDADAEAGRTESTAWLRHARHPDESTEGAVADVPMVLGSGSLGLITIPGDPHRLTREEIDARYPRLIAGLAAHPEIGFVLVRQANGSSVVLGNSGSRDLATGEVVGSDPLEPFGPRAVEQVAEVDGYRTVADLMINSRYDPELEEVCRVRGPGQLTRRSRRPADPPVPAVPERPHAARGADLLVPGDAQGVEGLAGRGRPSERCLRLIQPPRAMVTATRTTPNEVMITPVRYGRRPAYRPSAVPQANSITSATAFDARSAVTALSISMNGMTTGKVEPNTSNATPAAVSQSFLVNFGSGGSGSSATWA